MVGLPKPKLSAAVVIAAALALTACHRPAPFARPPVVVIGVDGGTWDLLDGFIEKGLLPHLARLRAEGAWARLESIEPTLSPIVWTSIATGKRPAKHGITGFLSTVAGAQDRPVNRSERRAKALWNVLGEAGLDVAVVGWFVTWPAMEVRGRLVSDRAHYGPIPQRTFPPAYLSTLAPVGEAEAVAALPRFMDFDYDATRARPGDADRRGLDYLVFDRFVRAYTRDRFYLNAAEAVLDDGRLPDFFALYLRGTDDVQHGFWKFMDPEPFGDVAADQVAKLGGVIERYWQWTDAALGEILARFGENAFVVVLSDHGAGPAIGEYAVTAPEHLHLSGAHRDDGILVVRGPGIRRGARIEGAGVLDVTPTILAYLGLPVARDMDGRVIEELFEPSLRERPVATIASYEDASDVDAGAPAALASDADDSILDHLRSLGYID